MANTTNQAQPYAYGGMDSTEYLEKLISNEDIPEHIQDELWALFENSNKLTFLDEDTIRKWMLRYELIRLTILESQAKGDYDEALELTLHQIGLAYEARLRQSKGKHLNMIELILTNTNASFAERQLEPQSTQKAGWISRLTSGFRGKKNE